MRCEGTLIQRRQEKSAPACRGERERELALAPLFICLSLPGPVLCKLGQPGVLFVLPEVLTPVLRPSFVSFSRACPFLVCSHRHLDSSSLFYLPNIPPSRDGRPNYLGIGASRSFWLFPAELGQRGVLGFSLLLV